MFIKPKDRAERMIENYAARLRAGQATGRRDGLTKAQTERYAAAVARTRWIRSETGAVLDAADVPTIVRPFYHSFALKLGKVDRNAWSECGKREEGRLLVETWVARGLSREIVYQIAARLFNLDLSRSVMASCLQDRQT